jgi:hypothetical protein
MKSFIAPVETIFDERAKHSVLLVGAIEESTNMAGEIASKQRHGLTLGRHISPHMTNAEIGPGSDTSRTETTGTSEWAAKAGTIVCSTNQGFPIQLRTCRERRSPLDRRRLTPKSINPATVSQAYGSVAGLDARSSQNILDNPSEILRTSEQHARRRSALWRSAPVFSTSAECSAQR